MTLGERQFGPLDNYLNNLVRGPTCLLFRGVGGDVVLKKCGRMDGQTDGQMPDRL